MKPITFAASLILSLAAALLPAAIELHVAPDGRDENPGTADRPFATLERARDALRELKSKGELPAGGATVWIGGGTYRLARPLDLDARDSGREDAPVVFRAQRGEVARITGGREVSGFEPLSDPGVLERLDPAARGRVLRADLRACGISDFGEVAAPGRRIELFFRDDPMPLARWPNEGFVRVVDAVGPTSFTTHGISGTREGRLTYEGDRPDRWRAEKDIWLHGYWFWDWSDAYQKVASIDREKKIIATEPPYHGYGYRKGQRYYALNILAELDRPGEWYLDRESGVLYFWPPRPVKPGDVVLSLAPSLLRLRDTSWWSLRGVMLEASRATAVSVEGGAEVCVAGCVIRNTGGWGATISGGGHHAVAGCDVYRAGEGGISLSGGDRKTLKPSGHRAENNHIHHFGRIVRTYRPAVSVGGVGQIVARNLIHDGPHNAIQLGGNDHIIELNEIHHVCFETGDVGAFYMGRDWTARGTVIRHNFFHDIQGPGLHGAMAVYLDDAASGITIAGNIFVRAGRAAFIGGGRDNLVENNVFVDCAASVHIDARGVGWMSYHVEEDGTLPQRLREMPYREPPWSERYPQLVNILDDEPGKPKGNVVRRNVSWGGRWLDVEAKAKPLVRFEENIVDEDPRFIGPDHMDYRLREGSPALEKGFRPLPLDEIGLVDDEKRRDRPVATASHPPRPSPPGPWVRKVATRQLEATSFRDGQPVAGTYYFYWYDDESKAHFIDHDGTDALTRHPAQPEGYSYKRSSWHHRELNDVLAAGLDFVLPVYWGYPEGYDGWSFIGLPPLVEAARELETSGVNPPRIGLFYDTSTLRYNHLGHHADLTTERGLEWLYVTVRDFFSLIPPDLWAAVDGRPLVWLYSANFAKGKDERALQYLRAAFEEDFAVEPFIVKEVSWPGEADATYAWGAALRPTVYSIAAVGPGYDHSAVPGRSPLVKEREGGDFYRRSWEWILARPLAVRPSIAVVETWNEWHEGTDIAPSAEDGRLYAEITRRYADLWHAGEVLRPKGPHADRTEVSVTLGQPNRSDGIEQKDQADGRTRAVEVEGRAARATVPTEHGGRYIYFDVADSFFWAEGRPVTFEITLLDAGTTAVALEYDSLDESALHQGAFKRAPELERTGSGRWRTVRLRIEDAAFTGRSNGMDFRLADPDGTLVVERVLIRKE
ncbi:MAG: DUF5010 domain-containing protein [Planctomycetes bacterium]|nr:DUF5010 domain-containing protein [Planctomycetota bacterium]